MFSQFQCKIFIVIQHMLLVIKIDQRSSRIKVVLYVKLNFKAGLFSSIFLGSFLVKSAFFNFLHMWLVVTTRMTKCVVCVLCNFVFFKKISPIFISMSLPVFCVFLCFCVFFLYCCVHVVGSTVSVFFVFLCFFLLSSVRVFSSKSVR